MKPGLKITNLDRDVGWALNIVSSSESYHILQSNSNVTERAILLTSNEFAVHSVYHLVIWQWNHEARFLQPYQTSHRLLFHASADDNRSACSPFALYISMHDTCPFGATVIFFGARVILVKVTRRPALITRFDKWSIQPRNYIVPQEFNMYNIAPPKELNPLILTLVQVNQAKA